MNWLNIHTPVLRSPEFIGCEPVARATWLYVVTYCCEQENGGVIAGAKGWKDRQWQQTCGVMLSEIDASAPLLKWNGNDLEVFAYPVDKEAEIKAKRISGKKGGKHRAQAARKAKLQQENGAVPSTASDCPSSMPPSTALDSASTEGEGEGEMEEERNELRSCAEPSQTRASAPPVMIFACDGTIREWPLTQDRIDEWQEAFPTMDILACCREARQWIISLPARRKTARGMPAFLNGWIGRAKDRSQNLRINGPIGPSTKPYKIIK